MAARVTTDRGPLAPRVAAWFDGFVRSRRARLALVTGLSAFGIWAFAPHVLSDISTEASVNAPLIRITAPVDGRVAALPPLGTSFGFPEAIGPVDPSTDTGALGELMSEADLADSARDLAERQLRELDAERARLRSRVATFSNAAVQRSTAALAGARAEAAACAADVLEKQQALSRAERLAATGFVSAAGLERARSAAAAADSGCRAAEARARAASIEADTARSGVFLAADTYNDAPYSSQQLDRLLLQRQLVETQAAAARERAEEAHRRLAAARARLTYTAPAGAIVVTHHASSGATIRAGEPVLDLVDCKRRFLEVSLPERKASVVDHSSDVQIRLLGSSEWLAGRVERIRGATARRTDPLLASAPVRASATELTVEISLPPATGDAGARRCDVGRTAEVRFSRLGG